MLDPYFDDYYDPYQSYMLPDVSVSLPSKQITLPGNIRVNFPGGTWSTSGGSSGARQAAVAITNSYEQAMQANLAAYQRGEISRDTALSNFDALWNAYVDHLSQCGEYEKQRAIIDRTRGGQFDWYKAYRDPIAGTGAAPGAGTQPGAPGGGIAEFLRRNLLWILIIVGALWWTRK